MILKRIVEFAETHAADQPTGYQKRFISKVIRLDYDGRLLGVIGLSGDKSAGRDGRKRLEPSLTRTSGNRALLIADRPDYVLGKIRAKDKPTDVEKRHRLWTQLVNEAGQATNSPELVAIAPKRL